MITEDGHDDKYDGREDGRLSDETTHTSIFTHNLHMIINQMENASLNFNLKYLSANTLPRKVVFDIHQDIQNMFLNPLHSIIGLLESSGCITADGKTVFDELFNNMRCNETEYKFIQYLKKNDLYAEPKEFVLSNELRPGIVRNEQQMSNDPITAILMPLKFQLRKYLESDGVLDIILQNLTPSSDGCIRTMIDGNLWKQRTVNCDKKLIVPLNVFFDDFTTGDTVSSHASKTSICGIYYYVPCLPVHILTKLSNIHIAGFILSEDRKEFDNSYLFRNLVDILIELEEEGLEIHVRGEKLVVHFMLGFITGDNLGLSGILDLVESARANYYCRLCKRNRTQRENDTVEYVETFRTIKSYEEDLILDDVSLSGIKRDSIFNEIPSFHVTYNVYFDLMHDLWEGVCVYGLGHYFNYFINVKKIFSLDELNFRKNTFVFGNLNSSNIPSDIRDTNISKSKIKMTTSEIKTLVNFLPLIIGMLIPEKDEVWNHFCLLLQICHILMLREIPIEYLDNLKKLIQDHHSQYLTLFNDTLKPKHHNLLHYATSIMQSGAPRHQWAMREEAKHRDSKQYSRATNNKINLCKSLAIKAGFKFASDVFCKNFVVPEIDLRESQILNSPLSDEHKQLLCADGIVIGDVIRYIDKFQKHGMVFSNDMYFYIMQHSLMSIFWLEKIILDNNDKLVLICCRIQSRQFIDHFQSFEVYKTNEKQIITNIEKLQMRSVNLHRVNEKLLLRFCNYVNIVNIVP
ncbi:uncharacterized protein LOC134292140 [Aedes albopictus]